MVKSTSHREGILATLGAMDPARMLDIEVLSVACFKAFPSLFSMDKFKEYPRMDRVTKRLSEIQQEGLIEVNKYEYKLSEQGFVWAEKNKELVNRAKKNLYKGDGTKVNTFDLSEQEIEKNVLKLKKSPAFSKYKSNKKLLTIADFMDFMRIDIYATRQLFERKIRRIKYICEFDEEINSMFKYLSNKYGDSYTAFKEGLEDLMVDKNG